MLDTRDDASAVHAAEDEDVEPEHDEGDEARSAVINDEGQGGGREGSEASGGGTRGTGDVNMEE